MHKTLSYYENNAKDLSQRYESAKVDHIHALLLNIFSPKSYLLEIGCGSGRDAAFMYRNGYDVLAIDGSREMIVEAKRCHLELADRLEVLKSSLITIYVMLFDKIGFITYNIGIKNYIVGLI